MRRITLWLLCTLTVLVLLLSYRTSTMGSGSSSAAIILGNEPSPGGTSSAGAAAATSAAATAGGSAGSAGPTGSVEPEDSNGTKTYAGSVVFKRWGPVQVTISVKGGTITDVAVPLHPTGNGRSDQINARALPILRQQTLAAQSAQIDTVSGATLTSEGYIESLQAALDSAHLS